MAHLEKIFAEARCNHWDQVRELIIQYELISHLNDEVRDRMTGNTLLHHALSHGADLSIIETLVTYIEINSYNSHQLTPLTILILNLNQYSKENQLKVMQFLLDHGADPMKMAKTGWTPYYMLAFTRHRNT